MQQQISKREAEISNKIFDTLVHICDTDPTRRQEFQQFFTKTGTDHEWPVEGLLNGSSKGVFNRSTFNVRAVFKLMEPRLHTVVADANNKLREELEPYGIKVPMEPKVVTQEEGKTNNIHVANALIRGPLAKIEWVSAKEVYEVVEGSVGKSTVYSILDRFVDHNVCSKKDEVGDVQRYKFHPDRLPPKFFETGGAFKPKSKIKARKPMKDRTKRDIAGQKKDILFLLERVNTITELVGLTGFARNTVLRRLEELEADGVVVANKSAKPFRWSLFDEEANKALQKLAENPTPLSVTPIQKDPPMVKPKTTTHLKIKPRVNADGEIFMSVAVENDYTNLLVSKNDDGTFEIEVEH